jgi:hypothetical protein
MISRVKSSNDQQITSNTTANDKNHRLEQPDLQPYHEYELQNQWVLSKKIAESTPIYL